jgi:hypothetical protein
MTRSRSSDAELAALDAALVEIVRAEAPITVRGVFYRAVARGLVEKDESGRLPQGAAAVNQAARGLCYPL